MVACVLPLVSCIQFDYHFILILHIKSFMLKCLSFIMVASSRFKEETSLNLHYNGWQSIYGSLHLFCTYFSHLSLEKCWPQKESDATITRHRPTHITSVMIAKLERTQSNAKQNET